MCTFVSFKDLAELEKEKKKLEKEKKELEKEKKELEKEKNKLEKEQQTNPVVYEVQELISGWIVIVHVSAIYVLHLGQEFHFIFLCAGDTETADFGTGTAD